MTTDENETTYALNLLRQSFPGRSDRQLIPIGMVYSGARWGRDFRFHEVPDIDGEPLFACDNEEEASRYFEWLADHLFHLEADPNQQQAQLAMLIKKMIPQDACLILGMHAALYLLETEAMEIHLQKGHSFEQYLKEEKKPMSPEQLKDLNEKQQRDLYEQVSDELMEWLELAPTVGHVDVPWRIPLSVTLKKVKEKRERIDMLNIFYGSFFQYIEGLDQEKSSNE